MAGKLLKKIGGVTASLGFGGGGILKKFVSRKLAVAAPVAGSLALDALSTPVDSMEAAIVKSVEIFCSMLISIAYVVAQAKVDAVKEDAAK